MTAAGRKAVAETAPEGLDAELAARLRAGDRAAFDGLMREMYEPLCRVAYRITRSKESAEDVVHDVLVAMWIGRERLPTNMVVRGYLFRAVRNRALNTLRGSEDKLVALDAVGPIPDTRSPANIGDDDLEAILAGAVRQLPKRCRLAYTLSREDGMSYADIASVMGITPKAVEMAIGRALAHLRAVLAPYVR